MARVEIVSLVVIVPSKSRMKIGGWDEEDIVVRVGVSERNVASDRKYDREREDEKVHRLAEGWGNHWKIFSPTMRRCSGEI